MTDRTLYISHDTSSPTVKKESLMPLLCVAAFEKRHIATMDVPGAYLNATLEHPHTIHIPRDVTEVYVRHRPELSRFVQPTGTILADLAKALYGLPEAGSVFDPTADQESRACPKHELWEGQDPSRLLCAQRNWS